MSLDDVKKLLSIQAIEQKIFKMKEMYHPNLIANLSKEAYDLYLIRKSIYDQLLTLLEEKDIDVGKVNDFIKQKIKESKKRLNEAKKGEETETIKITIEEWKHFLSD
jgi:hypothetical protein